MVAQTATTPEPQYIPEFRDIPSQSNLAITSHYPVPLHPFCFPSSKTTTTIMAMWRADILALTLAMAAALCILPTSIIAQSSSGCTNVLISLSPCLNYITGNSSSPSSSCCSQLSSVVKSQPRCLCQVIGGGSSSAMGININKTQALALPGACDVKTPSASQCPGSSSPSSPKGSTASPTSDSPASSGTGVSTGSKSVPASPEGDSSDGHKLTSTTLALLSAVLLTGHFTWGLASFI